MPQPKLFFLIQGPDAPSTRVRILNVLTHLRAAGFDADTAPYPNTLRGWFATWPRVRGADILVIQKRLPSPLESRFLRWRMKRIVFDFDDSVWLRNRQGDAKPSNKLRRRFTSLMKRVDLAICGNPILEIRARAAWPAVRTLIVPSGVPAPEGDAPMRANSPLRIGWVGTAINLPYLTAIEPALAAAHACTPFELVVICSEPPKFSSFAHVRFVKWTEQTEYDEIARFDAGIMPLVDNEHSRGKCAYKALQYMRCGVPVIASDVGVNREWIEGRGAGLVVKDDGWCDAIVSVLGDAEMRRRLGVSGVAAIRGGFRIEDTAAQYAGAFRALLEK